ncbi:MAG: 2-phospho-L-lactate transferase CofD family protein, partial [Candidatus Promineifilaceae bacterium]
IANIATQAGETSGYNVVDHVAAIQQHVPDLKLDMVLANDNLSPSQEALGQTVLVELSDVPGVRLVTADLMDKARPWRHDSEKLAEVVVALLDS